MQDATNALHALLDKTEPLTDAEWSDQREQAEQRFAATINRTVAYLNGIADAQLRQAVIQAYQQFAGANAQIVAFLKDPANYVNSDGKLKPLPIPAHLEQASKVPAVELPKAQAVDAPPKIEQATGRESAKAVAEQLQQGGTVEVAGVQLSTDKLGEASQQLADKAASGQLSEKLVALFSKVLEWLGRLFGFNGLGDLNREPTPEKPQPDKPATQEASAKPLDTGKVTIQQQDALNKLKAIPGFLQTQKEIFNRPVPPQNVVPGHIEGNTLTAQWKGIRAALDLDNLDRVGIACLEDMPFQTKEPVLIRAGARKVLVFCAVVIDWHDKPERIVKEIGLPLFNSEQSYKLRAAIAHKKAHPDDSRCTYFHHLEYGRLLSLLELSQKTLAGNIDSAAHYNAELSKTLREAKAWGLLKGDYAPVADLDAAKAQAKQIGAELAGYLAGPEFQP